MSVEPLRASRILNSYIADDMLPKCSDLVNKHGIEITKFEEYVQAYLSAQEITVLSRDHSSRFEQFVFHQCKKDGISKPPKAPLQEKNMNQIEKRPFSGGSSAETPNKMAKSADTQSPQMPSFEGGGEAYKNRKGKREPVLANPPNKNLGVRAADCERSEHAFGLRSRLTLNNDDFENCLERYRYMFTTVDQRASELERQLVRMRNHMWKSMCEKAGFSESDLWPLGVPSPDLVWVCGRIVCDAAEGKINKQSVMLEGSRRDARFLVRLDLKDIQAYSLFPGQIVLVQGINATGKTMVAQRIVEGIPMDNVTSTPKQLLEYHHSKLYQGGEALKVIAASGPFTTADSLNYAAMDDILKRVMRDKPDLLVLTGPFVDVTQPLLSKGDVMLEFEDDSGSTTVKSASYELVFMQKIRGALEALFNSEEFDGDFNTHIVLVPSLNDAHHECVFPQPPFGDRDRVKSELFTHDLGILDIPHSSVNDPNKRVHLMPNPCMFRLNEVVFAVTSNDALFSLSSDEASQNIGSRLDRLAGHMLQQASFAPQFPPPANTIAQMDLKYARHWQMKVSPDVLIVPSKLTYMAREVLGTLVINPGHLTRGVNGGTYAELNIHPMEEKMLRDLVMDNKEEGLKHAVASRTYANIMKI